MRLEMIDGLIVAQSRDKNVGYSNADCRNIEGLKVCRVEKNEYKY